MANLDENLQSIGLTPAVKWILSILTAIVLAVGGYLFFHTMPREVFDARVKVERLETDKSVTTQINDLGKKFEYRHAIIEENLSSLKKEKNRNDFNFLNATARAFRMADIRIQQLENKLSIARAPATPLESEIEALASVYVAENSDLVEHVEMASMSPDDLSLEFLTPKKSGMLLDIDPILFGYGVLLIGFMFCAGVMLRTYRSNKRLLLLFHREMMNRHKAEIEATALRDYINNQHHEKTFAGPVKRRAG